MPKNVFDILVVGSGLSSMIFAEEYLKKNRKINLISPDFKKLGKLSLETKLGIENIIANILTTNIITFFQFSNIII